MAVAVEELEAAPAAKPSDALRAGRIVLWIGVLMPFIYETAKDASEVAGGGSVGPMEMLRGGGPLVCLGVSILLTPVVRRGFGLPEAFLAMYCAAGLLSYANPLNPSPQASLLKALLLVFALLAIGRLVRLYESPSQAIVALTGMVHLVLLAGGVQLLLFKSAVYQSDALVPDSPPRLNLLVPAVSANPLAMFGVAGILACALGVAPRWLPFNVAVRNGLMLLYAYEIFLTRTRSALAVGLVIILVSIVLRARNHPLSSIATGLVVLVGAVMLTPASLDSVQAFLQRGQTTQGIDTLSGRTVIWSAAHQVWSEHPWFGLGLYSGHRLGIPGLSQGQSNIDNTWLETLVDVGILGMVPLALYVLTGLVRMIRGATGLRGDVRLWALGVTCYGVVISFINPTLQQPEAVFVLMNVLLLSLGPHAPATTEAAQTGDESWMSPTGRWLT